MRLTFEWAERVKDFPPHCGGLLLDELKPEVGKKGRPFPT